MLKVDGSKFIMSEQKPQYERLDVNRYLVRSFQGVFEAATHALGHGVSKVEYLCPESEHTNNTSGAYPRIMVFDRNPNNKYCAHITLCVNEQQLRDMQNQFNGELG